MINAKKEASAGRASDRLPRAVGSVGAAGTPLALLTEIEPARYCMAIILAQADLKARRIPIPHSEKV